MDCESIKNTSIGVLLEKSRTQTEMYDVALTELMSRITLSITSCSSPLTHVQKASGGGTANHAWQERDRAASVCFRTLSVTIRLTFSEDSESRSHCSLWKQFALCEYNVPSGKITSNVPLTSPHQKANIDTRLGYICVVSTCQYIRRVALRPFGKYNHLLRSLLYTYTCVFNIEAFGSCF